MLEDAVLDPALELLLLGGGEARLLLRGHEAGARVHQHAQPQIGLVEDLRVGFELVEGDLALVVAVAVALVAMRLRGSERWLAW